MTTPGTMYVVASIIGLLLLLYWTLPTAISWYLVKKFKLKVRIGRIKLPYLALKNVSIQNKGGFFVQIEEICLRSSFFNTEVTKLLSIYIRDIRISKDIQHKIDSPESTCDSENANKLHDDDDTKGVLDFRQAKVPPSIVTFAQFMAVHINNISIVLMNNEFDPGWFMHAAAKELHLDGSIVHNDKTLLVNAALNEAQAKILRHCPSRRQSLENSNKIRPCLGEISFDIALDATFFAHGPLSVDKLSLTMNNAKTTIHDGLYYFLREAKQRRHNPTQKPNIINMLQTKPKINNYNNEAYHKIAPIIPKNFNFIIKAATFSAVKENNQNDFSAKMQLFSIMGKFNAKSLTEDAFLPTVCTKVTLHHLGIDTKYEKLLFIEQFTIDSRLENDILNLCVKLKTFQIIYNHCEIYEWVHNNFLSRSRSGQQQQSILMSQKYKSHPDNLSVDENCRNEKSNNAFVSKHGLLNWITKHIVVKGCAELWNVSILMKLDDEHAAMSISHSRLMLEQFEETRSSLYQNPFINMLLNQRHWSTELMIESLWCSLGNATNDTNNLKKSHSPGSPLFLGVSLIKLSSYANVTKLDISIHTLRTEYSMSLAEFILKSVNCIKQYGGLNAEKPGLPEKPASEQLSSMNNRYLSNNGLSGLLVSAKIKDISCFFINHHKACILLSFSEITLSRNCLKLEEFQMAIMRSLTASSLCLTDFSDFFANCKHIRLEYERYESGKLQKIAVFILANTEAVWNTNLHMHLLTLLRDVNNLKQELGLPKRSRNNQISVVPNNHPLCVEISAERSTIFELKMSERNSMQFYVENMYITHKEGNFISAENLLIKIDDQHIFSLKEINIHSLVKLDMLTQERLNCEGFVHPTNKVWVTTIGSFKAIFPYDHDFYETVMNQFISHFKWLKLVHHYKKKPFTANSPLPSDIVVQIKEFMVEISDDPFEVKLRDNYVLLVDEYLESVKRKELFDKKIAERCSERLLVPAGTIEGLYASLVRKSSEIYIQRSKKIRESGPVRTRLLAWIMTDVEVMAMADPSIHGTENVTRIMRDIDSDSPWPEEGLEFITLWCRSINASCSEWKFMLRDFPQPMFYVRTMRLLGNLCGAEQMASKRAKRDVYIIVGDPFGTEVVQRTMTSLKFFHDFDCELDFCSYAFGPCWEPVMAQCNLSFEKISAPSKDPSPPLPFWDKMRLLCHGRLTMIVKQFTVLLHASLDPYNTTEEMELTWYNAGIVWTNAKIMFKGELNVMVRTASRYDDCRLLRFPNLKLTFKLNWVCLANPNDHHAVMPCAPDKLPEYSSNQEHDSFRAFRSLNLNIWISFETRPSSMTEEIEIDLPNLVLYGSTLRWFESLKLILSGVTRPTRRGPVFNNVRPRKKQLSRHYKKANLQMSLHRFQVLYWLSHAMQKGFQLNGGRVSFSSEYSLSLSPIDDGLIHRPRADWSTIYMNCELNDAEIWLRSILTEKLDSSSENLASAAADATKNVRFYFLSVAKVSYGREASLQTGSNDEEVKIKTSAPTHKLVVYDLKGAWTKNNRDVAFVLFDSFVKAQKLKNNLSTEAVKSYRSKQDGASVMKNKRSDSTITLTSSNNSSEGLLTNANTGMKKTQPASHATAMLQQLIAEADHKFNVYSDDQSTQSRELQLQGLQACSAQDAIHENWFISLVNSQVLLKGCETSGYVIISAAKAEILQRVHRPVWRDRSLVSKTTWKGLLECMQYYATVSAGEHDSLLEREIMWLTVDNIQDKDDTVINDLPDLPHLVGSGRSVGGVVSETVGASSYENADETQPVQLQRIVSRCKCEFFYVSYGDTIDPNTIIEVPPPPSEEMLSPWEKQDDPVDAFTLMHHDLDVCTNSLQYAMILDIVNNLLLYVEPQRKQALEKLARMRFQLQLHSTDDQKRPIQQKQTSIRSLQMKIRSLEKDIHMIGKDRAEEGDTLELRNEFDRVQLQIRESKEELNTLSEELDMMLLCYKETQLSQLSKISNVRADKSLIVRANEICFKRAKWRLTETDGQIGIADLVLSGFLYTKKSKSDDSVEHLLELGNIRMENLIPREIYREVLVPTEIQKDMPVDTHKRVLRVFCREKPPVGGISVKEHFEINVAPITIAITKKFYSTMLKFCFPDRDETESDDIEENSSGSSSSSSAKSTKKSTSKTKKSAKDSSFYVKIEKDDVEKMKERAEKNKLFIYIKIPEVPVRVSYKGNKEKNLEDITDFSLVVPTLEYHNVTWTWLDLLLAMKSASRRVILSQAIKQKLQIHRRQPLLSVVGGSSPHDTEDNKAKMLFGNRLSENRSQRKGVFKFTPSNK